MPFEGKWRHGHVDIKRSITPKAIRLAHASICSKAWDTA
jgi:hypothetical protein